MSRAALRLTRTTQRTDRCLSSVGNVLTSSKSQARELGLAEADEAAAQAVSGALTPGHLPTQSERVFMPWDEDALTLTIDKMLSDQECARLIEISEKYSYEEALVNVGGGQQVSSDHRKSSRWMVDSEDAVAVLWRRINRQPNAFAKSAFAKLAANSHAGWRPVGLNPRLRFLRYSPGDYFAPHSDGSFECEKTGQKSLMTLMLYLNTPGSGGETNFLHPYKGWRRSSQDGKLRSEDGNHVVEPGAPSGDACVSVRPTTGMALFFDHEMYHEGALLSEGVKYSIRTDVRRRDSNSPSASSALDSLAARHVLHFMLSHSLSLAGGAHCEVSALTDRATRDSHRCRSCSKLSIVCRTRRVAVGRGGCCSFQRGSPLGA